MEMPKMVRSADLPVQLAAKVFAALNPESVVYVRLDPFGSPNVSGTLVSYEDPNDLVYPEGWYFAKGEFRNKHNSSDGFYHTVPMHRPGGKFW